MRTPEVRAWQVVTGLSVVSAVILGLTICTMGMFLSPVTVEFGSTNSQTSRAATFFILAMTLATSGLGWLIERIGARTVMTGGALATALGYWLAAGSQTVEMFSLAMTLAGIGVGASTYVPSTILIASWIDQKRGLAMGLFMAITALGSAVFPVCVAHLLGIHGWRGTLIWISVMIAVVSIPLLLFVARTSRGRLAESEVAGDREVAGLQISEGLRTHAFWLLGLSQVLSGLSFQGVYIYIVPYLMGVGYSGEKAAALFGFANLTTIGGYLLFGFLADRVGAKPALATGLLVCGLSTPLLLVGADPVWGILAVIAFCILWGATCSLCNQLVPLLLSGAVGRRHFGPLLGMNYLMYGISMAMGPLIAGRLYDTTNGYDVPFVLFGTLMTVAAIPILLITLPHFPPT